MKQIPFLKFWAPQLLLNTDIMPTEKVKQPDLVTLLSKDLSIPLEEGALVKTGQQLAKDLISPYTGKISAKKQINGLNMEKFIALSLTVSSKEELVEGIAPVADFAEARKDELFSLLLKLGINFSPREHADTVVINTLDTDPLSTANLQTFRENSKSLGNCVILAKKLTGCSKCIVAIPKQLFNHAKKSCGSEAQIVIIKPVYPNGTPEILLQKLSQGSAETVNGAVIGIEYLLSMYTALKTGKPAQDTLITVTAPGLSVAKNLLVKIGTPLSEIIKHVTTKPGNNSKVILNGAMKGVACHDLSYPATLELSALSIQDEHEIVTFENNPCTNCGKCVAVCPLNLQVNLICRYSEYKIFDECKKLDVESCIECGLCAFSCMAHRPLIHYINHAKVNISPKKAKEQVS